MTTPSEFLGYDQNSFFGQIVDANQIMHEAFAQFDTTETLKNAGLKLIFQPHMSRGRLPTIPKVIFKAFITKFKDDHTTTWDTAPRFAGQGEIVHRQGRSGRTLNISFDVPSYGKNEAVSNLTNISSLVQMMFPTDNGRRNTSKMMWIINYANLIKDFSCIVESFSVTPNMDVGAFVENGIIYPKLFSVNISAKYQPMVDPDFKLKVQGSGLVWHAGDRPNPTYPYGVHTVLSRGSADKESPAGSPETDSDTTPTWGPGADATDTTLGNPGDPSNPTVATDGPKPCVPLGGNTPRGCF